METNGFLTYVALGGSLILKLTLTNFREIHISTHTHRFKLIFKKFWSIMDHPHKIKSQYIVNILLAPPPPWLSGKLKLFKPGHTLNFIIRTQKYEQSD